MYVQLVTRYTYGAAVYANHGTFTLRFMTCVYTTTCFTTDFNIWQTCRRASKLARPISFTSTVIATYSQRGATCCNSLPSLIGDPNPDLSPTWCKNTTNVFASSTSQSQATRARYHICVSTLHDCDQCLVCVKYLVYFVFFLDTQRKYTHAYRCVAYVMIT